MTRRNENLKHLAQIVYHQENIFLLTGLLSLVMKLVPSLPESEEKLLSETPPINYHGYYHFTTYKNL